MSYVLFLKPRLEGRRRNVVRDFVYGCWCDGKRVGGMQMPPLSDLYCATHLRDAGIEVAFLDAQLEPERYLALERTGFASVAAVVLLCSTQSFAGDLRVLSRVKELNPRVVSILYGSHPTFMPEYCLKEEAVDYLVIGEAEESLRALCLALRDGSPLEEVAGIGYRGARAEARLTPPRPFLDLDLLPTPDRSLLPKGSDYFNPAVKKVPYTTMQTSRGCPGSCIFCTAPAFYGRKHRFRSAGKVLDELAEISEQGYREVFFRDETFTAFKARNLEICEGMLSRELRLSWIANARVDMIDREAMTAMKRAGCHLLKFGVESGSDRMLGNYRKGITVEQTRRAFALAKEVGLAAHAHLVIGGPGETLETIRETVALACGLGAASASFGILTPYPGSELFERVAGSRPEIGDGSASTMSNLHVQGFFSESICGLSGAELSRQLVKAYRSFYLRPAYLLGRLRAVESVEELAILLTAATQIFQFALGGGK